MQTTIYIVKATGADTIPPKKSTNKQPANRQSKPGDKRKLEFTEEDSTPGTLPFVDDKAGKQKA